VDTKEAKKIGRHIAIKSGLIGLCIAYLLFAVIKLSWNTNYKKALFWIVDIEFKFHLFIGAVGLLTMAYFFGQLAGVEILIKKRNYWLAGVKYGILVLITGTLIGSSVGFLQEGIKNIGGFSNPFYDYYFKPMYWILMFGIVPAIIVGLLFGLQIKKQGNSTP
jgi:hypothetical protein